MIQEDKKTIKDFMNKYYSTLLPSSRSTYEAALRRYVDTGEIKKGFRPMRLFREYAKFCENLEQEQTISMDEMKEYIFSFVNTLSLTVKSRNTYRSGLFYHLKYGSFGNYRISNGLWTDFIKYVESKSQKEEDAPIKDNTLIAIVPTVSKDAFDKRAKDFIDSYRVKGKGLYKEIKADILTFIKKYLYGNYEKDYQRLNTLTYQQKEVFEQYKTVILSFMETYKPEQSTKEPEHDLTDRIHSIQTQITSLTSVIGSLKNELERLSMELSSFLN